MRMNWSVGHLPLHHYTVSALKEIMLQNAAGQTMIAVSTCPHVFITTHWDTVWLKLFCYSIEKRSDNISFLSVALCWSLQRWTKIVCEKNAPWGKTGPLVQKLKRRWSWTWIMVSSFFPLWSGALTCSTGSQTSSHSAAAVLSTVCYSWCCWGLLGNI